MHSEQMTIVCPVKPGNGATAYFFDSTADQTQAYSSTNTKVLKNPAFNHITRAKFSLYVTAQNVTAYLAYIDETLGDWTVENGGGSGETVTAGTRFTRDWNIATRDFRIYVTAGGTAPTIWDPSLVLVFGDNAPSM